MLFFELIFFTYGIPRAAINSIGIPFITHHHKKRKAKKIWMLHIYNEDVTDRISYLNKLPYARAKYHPKEFSTDANTLVCGDEVMIIHWKKNPFIIHLKHEELAEVYKKYFKLLWKLANPKDLKIKGFDLKKI